MHEPDSNDPALLGVAEVGLLIDQYELTMSASYHRREMNQQAVFELFVRSLPPHRSWLLFAGLGPTLALLPEIRFGAEELEYLGGLGFDDAFLDYLAEFRFSGDIEAMPEGTLCFAEEPMLRVTAPRIEAQILETLLLNQLNFQTAIATKAARVVLAAGGGKPGSGDRVMDFSPRRDHGIDAAMKAARSAAVAGCGGTSNLAAAMRYGLRPVGTMAHSYVLSFPDEQTAFRAFMEDFPEGAVMLVDTYDTLEGVRNAIAAAREAGSALQAIRLDSGDLWELSRAARRLLDASGLNETRIVASGDLEERRIADLVAREAPIDAWGVGTDLGTSRDAPAVGGVYKLVAHADDQGDWRSVAKHSPAKQTIGGPKQVFRTIEGGVMRGDVIAAADEDLDGTPLLVPAMRDGKPVLLEDLEQIRRRTADQLRALPPELRRPDPPETAAYPVEYSGRLLGA